MPLPACPTCQGSGQALEAWTNLFGMRCTHCRACGGSRELDTDGTDQMLCPACGHAEEESYLVGRGQEGLFEDNICNHCGARFSVIRHIHVTYTTTLEAL